MFVAESILFGICVGLSLALTGGGGSLLAMPMLVYGLSLQPSEANGVSLAAVGATALVGVVANFRAEQIHLRAAIFFALAGMIGAPLGMWVSQSLSEGMLLALFSTLMLFVAWRMWCKSSNETTDYSANLRDDRNQFEEDYGIDLTLQAYLILVVIGFGTGILSGMFGVGGGFLIVPALVFFTKMPIHKAVATSLLVIALVSLSGVASHFVAGHPLSVELAMLFATGGTVGMFLGSALSKKLSTQLMQKVFAVGISGLAVLMIGKSLL